MLINKAKVKENEKSKREIEWAEVEALVMTYQARFTNNDKAVIKASQDAAQELVIRFQPLFTKYLRVIKKCDVNFFDAETKAFVFSFIDKPTRALFPENKKDIIYKFKFGGREALIPINNEKTARKLE